MRPRLLLGGVMSALRKPFLFLLFVLLATPGQAVEQTYGNQPVLWEFFDYVTTTPRSSAWLSCH